MIRQAPRLRAARRARGAGTAAALVACALGAWGVMGLALCRPAAAQVQRRVLLVIEQADDLFAERIRAEVAGLGLEVVTLEPWRSGEAVGRLDAMAREVGAAAGLRMIPTRKGVEIWMADQTTGRSLLRQLVVDESDGGPNQGLVALQTAELLRTSLLSGAPAAVPVPQHPTDPRQPEAGAERREPPPTDSSAGSSSHRERGAQIAAGALFGGIDRNASFQGWLSLHRSIGEQLGVSLDASAPVPVIGGASVSGPEGSADVKTYLVGATVLVRLPTTHGLHAAAGVGAGVLAGTFKGHAEAPLVAQSTSKVTGVGYLRGELGFEMTRWLRVGFGALIGATVERISVRFAGNEAAAWGFPLLAAFVGADLHW